MSDGTVLRATKPVEQSHGSLLATRASGNHAALEQFVGDGRRHAVEELHPHLWIVLQDLHGTLLHLRLLHSWGLASLQLKGLTG